jgi:hypothetical protein
MMVRAAVLGALLAAALAEAGCARDTSLGITDGGSPGPDAAVSLPDTGPAPPDAGSDLAPPTMDVGLSRPDGGAEALVTPDGPPLADGPPPGGFSCLPDQSGGLLLETTGGLVLNLSQGNEARCVGLPGAMSNVQIDWVVTDPASGAMISFNMDLPNFGKGQTGNKLPVSLSVLGGAPVSNIWNATDCTIDVNENSLAEVVGSESRYKLRAAVRCPNAIPGVKPSPLVIGRFDFTTRVTY